MSEIIDLADVWDEGDDLGEHEFTTLDGTPLNLESKPPRKAEAAYIHIVGAAIEDGRLLRPKALYINGHEVLAPADDPVIIHESAVNAGGFVKVTLTMYVQNLEISAE